MEVCSESHFGPYISIQINLHRMFFVIDTDRKNITIMYHDTPSSSIIGAAVLIRATMMAYMYPIHTMAAKISKRD